MTSPSGPHGGYRRTYSFIYTCLVYHATCVFCQRFLDTDTDPLGKTSGQMIGAARSARQNIVEGSSRAGISRETELQLYDVAKGSLDELSGDYEVFLDMTDTLPWSPDSTESLEFKSLQVEPFSYAGTEEAERVEFAKYFREMRLRFAPWLENENPVIAANAILLAIDHSRKLLAGQIRFVAKAVTEQGGFSERMTSARIQRREEIALNQSDGPKCPKCDAPMRKAVARRGKNAGRTFWSCLKYPNCDGTRDCEES